MSEPLLTLRDITKTYRTQKQTIHALKGVNVTINHGEILSLLGVNGAGKTTLSSIIATIHPPTSGDIEYKGSSIYRNIMAYRMQFGLCPQKANFEKNLNVTDILTFAGRYYGMNAQAIERRVQELLTRFDLTSYAHASPSILSGGYKQRLLIARAVMHNPSLVIFDEPTVGLDPHIRRQIWQFIRDLKASGVTVILTTHYLDEAEQLSDRVCILDKGVIQIIDTPTDLKNRYQKQTLEEVFLHFIDMQSAQ